MRAAFPLPTLLVTLIAASTGSTAVLAASVLDGLDEVEREAVVRHCLPERFRGGAAAYRNCVTEAAAGDRVLAGTSSGFSFDERHAAERACADEDADAFETCVERQLNGLEGALPAALEALATDERHALRRQCAADASAGAAAYRGCLERALETLRAAPAFEPAALGPLARNRLGDRCARTDATVVDYRRCLLEAIGVTPGPAAVEATGTARDDPATVAIAEESVLGADTPDTAATEPDTGTAEPDTGTAEPDTGTAELEAGTAELDAGTAGLEAGATATEPPLGAAEDERPAARESSRSDAPTDPTTDASDDDLLVDDAGDGPDGVEVETDRVGDVWSRLGLSVSGLGDTERLLLGAAVVLPLLLLAGWAMAQRSRRAASASPTPAAAAPAASGAGWRAYDDDGHEDDPFDTWPAEPLGTASVSAAKADDGGDPAAEPLSAPPSAPRSEFGRWLAAEPAPRRLDHAIELLIYWMAYGDERYTPESRARVLGADRSTLDSHDRIKRHVLEQDTLAFADTVRWLQSGTDAAQRAQVLDLLMVLLVEEAAMSPVQNTLLRFLGDAFGVDAAALDARHRALFGSPMPELPRVDLPLWWERFDPADTVRWDSGTLAALGEEARYRARLGLPLEGELDEEAVDYAFERAMRRCDPDLFDALGARERTLVERQRAKLVEARDHLLGESA